MDGVASVRTLWSAFTSRGPLATLEHLDAQCVWVPSADVPDESAIHGVDAIRARIEEMSDEGVRLEPALHRCEDLGDDRVLVSGRLRVLSRGALLDSPLFWLYRVRGKRIVRVEAYPTRSDALSATAAPA